MNDAVSAALAASRLCRVAPHALRGLHLHICIIQARLLFNFYASYKCIIISQSCCVCILQHTRIFAYRERERARQQQRTSIPSIRIYDSARRSIAAFICPARFIFILEFLSAKPCLLFIENTNAHWTLSSPWFITNSHFIAVLCFCFQRFIGLVHLNNPALFAIAARIYIDNNNFCYRSRARLTPKSNSISLTIVR